MRRGTMNSRFVWILKRLVTQLGLVTRKQKKISWIKKALVDTLGIKSADLRDKFLF